MTGLGRSNLHHMRAFSEAWPEREVVQQAVGRLPWGHVTVLLDSLSDAAERDWYVAQAVTHGWSRNVLAAAVHGPQRHRRPLLLGAASSPMAVAAYTYDELPPAEKLALPAAHDVAAAMQRLLVDERHPRSAEVAHGLENEPGSASAGESGSPTCGYRLTIHGTRREPPRRRLPAAR